MPTAPTPIDPLGTPPSTTDPTNFDTRADALFVQLPTFVTQTNNLALNVKANADEAASSASDAAGSAAAAAGSQAAAAASAGAVPWVSGTVYATGARVVSSLNGQVYRRTSAAGSGAVDPSQDFANYARVYAEPEMVTAESFFF